MMNSRSTQLLIASALSIFLGLQFCHLTVLLQTSLIDTDATEYTVMSPAEINANERESKSELGDLNTTSGQPHRIKGTGKKSPRLPRYVASNYHSFEPLHWSLPKPSSTRYQTSEEFMADYISLKRKHNISLPWEQDKYKQDKVTLPRPIIGLNFPKSATTTMSKYFQCAGIISAHTSTLDGRIGICMMENHLADKPPMDGCSTRQNYTDPTEVKVEVVFDIGIEGPPCYYASVHNGGLENIAKHYPEGTIMLVTRNATKWFNSLERWNDMHHMLNFWGNRSICGFDGSLEGKGMEHWTDLYHSSESKREYWIEFYEAHTQKIREFALAHLSLTYLEVELEHEKVAEQLERFTGVKQTCFKHCLPGQMSVSINCQNPRSP